MMKKDCKVTIEIPFLLGAPTSRFYNNVTHCKADRHDFKLYYDAFGNAFEESCFKVSEEQRLLPVSFKLDGEDETTVEGAAYIRNLCLAPSIPFKGTRYKNLYLLEVVLDQEELAKHGVGAKALAYATPQLIAEGEVYVETPWASQMFHRMIYKTPKRIRLHIPNSAGGVTA